MGEINNFLPALIWVTVEDIRLKTILKIEQNSTVLQFGRLHFFQTFYGFTKPGKNPRSTFNSEKPTDISGIFRIHIKRVGISGIIIYGKRELILYSFSQDTPFVHKTFRNIMIKYHKKKFTFILSDVIFYFEDEKKSKELILTVKHLPLFFH